MDKIIKELRDTQLELTALKARKDLIKQKALEHRDTITNAEIDAEKAELFKINNEIKEKEDRIATLQKEERKINMDGLDLNNQTQVRDERAKTFLSSKRTAINVAEIRSTLVASGGIAKPTPVKGIVDGFPTAISIVDQVNVEDATGSGAYKVSYQKKMQEASEKTDGEAQAGSDAEFGTVTISPTLLATTSYVSRELQKLTPLRYYEKVVSNAIKALKVKLADWILNGNTKQFKGIKNSINDEEVATNMFHSYKVTANTIGENFLRDLVLNYGGEENAYGGVGTLYLNKADLIAIGKVRGTNEKKALFEITPDPSNPNIGTIKEGGLIVNYCICPTLTSLVNSTIPIDASKIQTMVYGIGLNYDLALFGDYEVRTSEDYKFAEGLVTVLGEVMVGGSITVPDGFSVVTLEKAAA